ncbi:MAG: sigma-54-dependent Fis family transcriptional regulator [Thermoanaerobaculia bacterium]|nr:sigma-54-dependent Fis family transcriptional regulator [Thermoanaerobaculia bacterium]
MLTLIAHPHLARIGEQALLTDLEAGGTVEVTRRLPLFGQPWRNASQPLADRSLSRNHPLVLSRGGARGSVVIDARQSSRSVQVDGEEILGQHRVISPLELSRGVVLLLARRIALLLHAVQAIAPTSRGDLGIIGESCAVTRARNQIASVARSGHPVLIRGETGTGKELVAHAIHQLSGRRPLIPVSLAAIPAHLVAAELFGAVKGAYTDLQRDRPGKFLEANRGTLFLDEIGDISPETQTALLRALEERTVTPLGGGRPTPIDVRVLAATDHDLEHAMEEGRFRQQLFYRLQDFQVWLPPLRERREDIGRLFVHLLREDLQASDKGDLLDLADLDSSWLPGEVGAALALHSWPGNIRELRGVVRRIAAAGIGADGKIDSHAIAKAVANSLGPEAWPGRPTQSQQPEPSAQSVVHGNRRLHPSDLDRDTILKALNTSKGSTNEAAAILGIGRTSLYKAMARCGVKTSTQLSEQEIRDAWEQAGGRVGVMARMLYVSRQGLCKRLKELGLR